MLISEYHENYQQQIIALIIGIQQGEFAVPIGLNEQPDLLTIPEVYQIGAGNFWVALEGESVIGTIALIDLGAGCGTIRKLFVAPAFRGQAGVAKALLQTLLDWSQQKGVTNLYLGTTALFKGAHRFYEKNGFQSIQKAQLPKPFPLVEVDSVYYSRDLQATTKVT